MDITSTRSISWTFSHFSFCQYYSTHRYPVISFHYFSITIVFRLFSSSYTMLSHCISVIVFTDPTFLVSLASTMSPYVCSFPIIHVFMFLLAACEVLYHVTFLRLPFKPVHTFYLHSCTHDLNTSSFILGVLNSHFFLYGYNGKICPRSNLGVNRSCTNLAREFGAGPTSSLTSYWSSDPLGL